MYDKPVIIPDEKEKSFKRIANNINDLSSPGLLSSIFSSQEETHKVNLSIPSPSDQSKIFDKIDKNFVKNRLISPDKHLLDAPQPFSPLFSSSSSDNPFKN